MPGKGSRKDFGISEEAFVFLFSLDFSSRIHRKNPGAVKGERGKVKAQGSKVKGKEGERGKVKAQGLKVKGKEGERGKVKAQGSKVKGKEGERLQSSGGRGQKTENIEWEGRTTKKFVML